MSINKLAADVRQTWALAVAQVERVSEENRST